MVSKDETIEIIKNEFYREGGIKDALMKDFERSINAQIGRWLIGGGVLTIFAISAAWFSLKAEVDNHTKQLEKALNEDQAALIIQRLSSLEETVREKNNSIKELDERLRKKGI